MCTTEIETDIITVCVLYRKRLFIESLCLEIFVLNLLYQSQSHMRKSHYNILQFNFILLQGHNENF